MYQLEFLPIARQDMTEIASYISQELCNPSAAEKLANDLIQAAGRLVDFPFINAVHQTNKPLRKEYRKLIVKNYIIFYWIDEDEKRVTVARVIYGRRNYDEIL